MIPWAKGFIASQVLNAHLVGPSWGLNARRYWRNFRTSRLDFVGETILRSLPGKTFTEADYYSTGILDYGEAIGAWAKHNGLFDRRHFLVSVGGMYGGYHAISTARSFLWSQLLNSRNALSNIFKVHSKLDRRNLFVSIHMRLSGDFSAAEGTRDVRSTFNLQIPIAWYRGICEDLRGRFKGRIEFCFFTDKETPEYLELVSEYNPEQIRCRELSECSDLLLMAASDLRICSVSSYSMAACFLSAGPYVWYEPQLHMEDGMYSLWGHELRQRDPEAPTASSARYIKTAETTAELRFRGYPVRLDCSLPESLLERLEATFAEKDSRTDLMQYGCYPCGNLANE
jgi:hypothetical protein